MKTVALNLLLAVVLTTAVSQASADHRDDRPSGFSSNSSLQWRLGNMHRDQQGYEILYRENNRRRWMVAPGAATAIGDGWVLGTDRHRGGFGIYRFNGRDWNRMPGTAVQIGGSYARPWVINDRNVRYVWDGRDWRQDRDNYNDRRARENQGNKAFDRDRRDNNSRNHEHRKDWR